MEHVPGMSEVEQAERQRDTAIATAQRECESRKKKADERAKRFREAKQLGPGNEYLWQRERLLAEQECIQRSATAWATYWEGRAAYWSGQLAELDQAFEAHKQSLG